MPAGTDHPARRRRAADPPSWWRDAVVAVCGLRAVVVTLLWLVGGGLTGLLGGTAQLLTSVGRLTGLVAADLLLVQVLLMARLPLLERTYGQDELARRHRVVGFTSFSLLLTHIALITVGYAMTARSSVLGQLVTLTTQYGGMLLAVAGTLALTVVAGTSVRAARRRLRYESWHLLHLYAYLGVGLSVPHELWTGQDFSSSSVARVYWWGSYVVAAGALVGYRVVLPLARSLRHGVTVREVVRETPDVVTVRMRGRALDRLPVRAGQYFVLRFLDGPGWSRGNPYSLSAAPGRHELQITARALGDGSSRLLRLRPGTPVLLEGPHGTLTAQRRTRSKVTMIASGIGITPLRALLEELDYRPGDATLLYRASHSRDLVFRTELDALAAQRGIAVHYLVGPRGNGVDAWLPQGWSGRRRSALRQLAPDLLDSDVYLCGPDEWMRVVTDATARAGLPAEQLHVERFTW